MIKSDWSQWVELFSIFLFFKTPWSKCKFMKFSYYFIIKKKERKKKQSKSLNCGICGSLDISVQVCRSIKICTYDESKDPRVKNVLCTLKLFLNFPKFFYFAQFHGSILCFLKSPVFWDGLLHAILREEAVLGFYLIIKKLYPPFLLHINILPPPPPLFIFLARGGGGNT